MSLLDRIRQAARALKRDGLTLWYALKDPATPWWVKALIAFVVGYALSPMDLIPDFIPVLGLVDDLILLPALIWLALHLLPEPVKVQARARCEAHLARQQAKVKLRWGGVLIIALWCAALLGLVSMAMAQPQPTVRATQALLASGLEGSLDGLAPLMRQRVAQDERLAALSAPERGRLQAAIDRAFDAQALKVALNREFAAHWSSEDEQPWLAWLATPAGRRLATQWRQSLQAEPAAFDAEVLRGRTLVQSMAPERRQRLQALLDASDALPRALDLMADTTRALHRGFAKGWPGQLQALPAEIERDLQLQLPVMRQMLGPVLLQAWAARHESWSDQELDDAVSALQSPVARRFTAALSGAARQVLRQANEALGQALSLVGDARHL